MFSEAQGLELERKQFPLVPGRREQLNFNHLSEQLLELEDSEVIWIQAKSLGKGRQEPGHVVK